ncbi:MAG: excinuclease ABC subunit UvrA, partial [Sediminibacterium sp.]
IYDLMRILYSLICEAYSYETFKKIVRFSEEDIISNIFEILSGAAVTLLAPIVRGRKGHYRELFEEIRKKGFLKVRVDGEIVDIKPKMQVDRYKIHDIEVVIDRLPVKEDMKVRISQSVQQSLKMGNDLMFLLLNQNGKLIQYSRHLMCEDTGISYEEPSPNTFSFNSPYGACPTCRGLGQISVVDMESVIPDPSLSVRQGGIVPLGEERQAYLYQSVETFAKKNKINLDKPLHDLTLTARNLLLFGTPDAGNLEVVPSDDSATGSLYDHSVYEGIVPMLQRWFTHGNSTEALHEWVVKFMQQKDCPACEGQRLKKESRWFLVQKKNIAELSKMDLSSLQEWLIAASGKLSVKQQKIARDILKEIQERLQFLLDVGLHYLTIERPTRTLSGGESQRIRLATQIGSRLQGITYILDEPSIGLHQRDNQRLIKSLLNLRDIGNNVLVVEHDKDIMLAANYLVDIGPGAGRKGGNIVAAGTPEAILNSDSETASYLKGEKKIPVPKERRKGNGKWLELKGAKGNNLKNVTIQLPLGSLIVVSGVSGSGKSTLINETLYPLLSKHCYNSRVTPMPFQSISGLENIDKVIEIDQSPIGRTPRSNPATYCGFFTEIRSLFAAVPEAKIRGYAPGRFSFNVKGGRCDVCEGGGMRVIEMNFLPDVYVHCEKCNGQRYNRETLEIRYKGKSISDVLNMTVDEAVEFFQPIGYLYRKIKVLQDVGLGYITLGQSAVTLSGGEAQRVKLATELGKKDTGKTFYILDEPTTGLHFQDILHLLQVLNQLVNRGNTVLIIEHNMDVIKVADYIIDLGPEGGDAGGKILFQGVPEKLVAVKESNTAPFLRQELAGV